MTFERTRKGNPLELTVNQHFHTAHSISKFYNSKNKVEVFDIKTKQFLECKKDAKIFCAKRNWDERSEKGYMQNIEDSFHEEIDDLVSYENRDHSALSKYFVLWRLRHKFHVNRLPNAPLTNIEGSDLTKEQQEILEKQGVGFLNNLAEIPARQLTGTQIQLGVNQLMQTFKNIKWGLLTAQNNNFLSADAYHEICFIPISAKLAFAGNLPDKLLTDREVVLVNKQSVSSASNFYFAQNITQCLIA